MKVAKLLFFDTPEYGRVEASDGSFKPAGMTREDMVADTGPIGPTETPAFGELSFTLPNNGVYDEVVIGTWIDLDITVVDDNGRTRQCQGCFTTEQPTLSGGNIPVSMHFTSQVMVS